MKRLLETLGRLRSEGRKALIPYITAGDPGPKATVPILHALVEAGADVLELGVPFSDPSADGPVIQLACERAIAGGTGLSQVLDMVAEFRQTNTRTPVVLMGYLNPIEVRGPKEFAAQAVAAGVDGVLLVDLPVEEAEDYLAPFKKEGLASIFLIAPTSPPGRIRAIAEVASGYLYYVSIKGVTGAASLNVEALRPQLEAVRALSPLPLAVGFGIRDAATAQAVARISDGVVVGSLLVAEIEANQFDQRALPKLLAAKLAPLRAALDEIK